MRYLIGFIAIILLPLLVHGQKPQQKRPPAKASSFIKGCYAYDHAEYDTAMLFFKKALKEEPNNVKVYINAGLTEERLHDTVAALSLFQKALTVDPKYMRVYRNIASIYYDRGDFQKAEIYYTKAITLEPLQDESYYDRSMIRFRQRQYEDALKDIYKAIKLKPDKALYYYHRARIEVTIGDYKRGLDDINIYIEKVPEDPRALQTRAIIKRYYNDMQGAVDDYTKAIALAPRSKSFYVGRSGAYTELGQYSKAIADCEKAEAIDQRYAEANFFAGIAWMDSGKVSNAIKMFTAAIEKDPRDPRAYDIRGYLYQLQGSNADARKDYEAVIAINPGSTIYLNLSDVLASAEDTAAALAVLDSFLKVKPYYPTALLRKGKLIAQTKRDAKAGDDMFRQVLNHTRDSSTLAFAYFYLGDTVLPTRILNYLYSEAAEKNNMQMMNTRLGDLAYYYALSGKKEKFYSMTMGLLEAGFIKLPWLASGEIDRLYPNDPKLQTLETAFRKLLEQ
jgi:tetratricopeptide (TPR) repeat protein